MAADKKLNMTPDNTNAEVKKAFEDAVQELDRAEGTVLIKSEQDMLDTAVGSMDETARRTRPPALPQ